MDATSLARDLIAALEELRVQDAKIIELKKRLLFYELNIPKGKTEKGRIIQFHPARIQQHTS
jgi:hypothetical protein